MFLIKVFRALLCLIHQSGLNVNQENLSVFCVKRKMINIAQIKSSSQQILQADINHFLRPFNLISRRVIDAQVFLPLCQKGKKKKNKKKSKPPFILQEMDSVRFLIQVWSMFPMKAVTETLLARDLADRVHGYTWFINKNDRDLVKSGLDLFVPCNFHEVPRLCRDFIDIDMMVTMVSPMDKAGFFSFGSVNE